MKIGCLLYPLAMKNLASKAMIKIKTLDYIDALQRASTLGFKGVGGIIRTPDMDAETIGKLKEKSETLNIEIAEFVAKFGIENMSNKKREIREKAIEYFRESAIMASELGAKVLNTTSHDPFAYEKTIATIWMNQNAKIQINLPANFNWLKIWDRYVETIGRCADIAQEQKILYAIEPHPFQIVDNTNMALKLIEDVGSKNLGICFDTAQVLMALEIPSVSIYKLKNRIFHTHISDNLGSINSPVHLPLGAGKIEWDETLKALNNAGYDYFLSFEIRDIPFARLDAELLEGISFLKEVCFRQKIKIE